MCLLMWKPATVALTKSDVADYYAHNPDGFGVMWQNPDTGGIGWYKMVGSKKATWKAYQQYGAGRDCALHWRMATSGAVNVAMAHPFKVVDGVMLMHNGVLACKSSAGRSDTAEFASIMRRELARHPERLDDESYINALDEVIGPGNRLLFMRAGRGEPVIVGREKGIEHNGAWYSNEYAWTNDYFTPGCSWAWKDENWESATGNYVYRAPPSPGPVIDLADTAPRTPTEKAAVAACRAWFENHRYAGAEETIEYFLDWYGGTGTDAERARLHAVLAEVAYGA